MSRLELPRTTSKEIGHAEQFNRVIADTISENCAKRPQEWDLYLPYVTFVYNTTVHKIRGTTPFSMLYGNEAQYPIELYFPKPPGDSRLDLGEVDAEWSENLYEVHTHDADDCGKNNADRKNFIREKSLGSHII